MSDDRVAIQELTASYNRAADSQDGDRLAELFTDDGALIVASGSGEPRTFRGPQALSEMISSQAGTFTAHLTTDAVIKLSGDEASQTCALLVVRREPAADRISMRIGRYTDDLTRTADGWRFVRRQLALEPASAGFLAV